MMDVPSGKVRMLLPGSAGALRLIETTSNSARGVCAEMVGTMASATRNTAAARGMAAGFYAPASISATTGKWSEAMRAVRVECVKIRQSARVGWTQMRSSATMGHVTGNDAGRG